MKSRSALRIFKLARKLYEPDVKDYRGGFQLLKKAQQWGARARTTGSGLCTITV